MAGKEPSAKQVQLKLNQASARDALKSHGKKANAITVSKFVKHRREGRSNADFLASLESGAAVAAVTAIGENEPLGATTVPAAAAARNTTAKKPRTAAQAAANARQAAARAALKATGLKANAASVKKYLNAQLATGTAAAVAPINLLGFNEPLGATAAAAAPSGHVAAGKKAAMSEKGAGWLRNVAATRKNIVQMFRNADITRNPMEKNIKRIAGLRRTNRNAANAYTEEIIARAQSNIFNKRNKTFKKSIKKNNTLGRTVRNFVNRRRSRIVRGPKRNYGTFNQTKRNKNSSYRPFKNNNNDFNVEELRNVPFNSAQ